MEDLSSWLTIPEFAKAVGKSTRSIERLVAGQLIRSAKRSVEGKKPVVVIDPEEIEKQKAVVLRPVVQKTDIPATRQADTLPAKATTRQADMPAILRALEMLRFPVSQKVFLSLREAAYYLGYPQAEVKRLVDAGIIPTHTLTNGWKRIARADLDQYRPTNRQVTEWRNGDDARH